ncbi:BEN domain-containing protein 6-like isoform X1 [Gymnodraco acuticeps]|uniref:BEN domain-containing protein 6-like isoform X1 n=1 Tax=Gymnodraco acuticeps TaxID=8218 RepID=A0A6P8U4H6_GYMAC|nr:BEN domain-containing protein 6-like isoform X1 [Gymnodraco acuticeps]XP_034071634.1 BEN domain-containing protein 6-like isoform X1 [Gymnodraco acuticeps]XP_034071635.1 BEN domain-containing protein 6-like isoform X1 [Gymnodraco acuticeps]
MFSHCIDDKGALLKMRNRLVEGKEPLEQSGPMGKGKRAKKRRPFLEDDDDVEQSEERPSKKLRPESSSSTDIIQKYKDLQKAQEVNKYSYQRTLEERIAALERENYSLRNALSIIEGLPRMISSMQQLAEQHSDRERKPEEEGRSTAHTSTAGPSLKSSTTHLPLEDGGISTDAVCLDIKQAIKDRCSKSTAAKYTNDLMHGLYTTAFMAAHSVTGLGASSRGETRPSLPSAELTKIVCEVKSVFKEKTEAEIKGYIRQKLSNSAKILKRKTF